uniref:Zinc finger protein 576 n=1 Tax=Pipistrellus kuhlii TaxID=59472 RepID=A0A7J7R953_PIPKU|nr:zinc finger protein 576 [Pipistrellus kuhlii]
MEDPLPEETMEQLDLSKEGSPRNAGGDIYGCHGLWEHMPGFVPDGAGEPPDGSRAWAARGGERDRELETSMREKHRPAASCTPPTGDVPQPMYMPLTGIEPGTFQSADPTLYH